MEVDSAVSRNDFMSGKIFGRGGIGVDTTEVESKPRFASASSLKKKFVPLRLVSLNASAPVKSTSDDTSYLKRGIVSLRPVDLVQNTENEGHPQDTVVTAYWFANWCDAFLDLSILNQTKNIYFFIGENLKQKSTRLGMEMHISFTRERNSL